MNFLSCPTRVVDGSPERVWALLTRADHIAQWTGSRLIYGPKRDLVAGDRIVLGPGYGQRGKILLRILGRTLVRGPEQSLDRLVRAAAALGSHLD